MDSDYSGDEMDPMKDAPPPPWFEDSMRKSYKIANRSTNIQQEILDRLTQNEERTKSMQNTIDQYKDTVKRLENTVTRLESTVTEYESTIARLTIQNSQLTTELQQQATQKLSNKDVIEEFSLLEEDFQSPATAGRRLQSSQHDTAYGSGGEGPSPNQPLAQGLQSPISAHLKGYQHLVTPILSRRGTSIHHPRDTENANRHDSSFAGNYRTPPSFDDRPLI